MKLISLEATFPKPLHLVVLGLATAIAPASGTIKMIQDFEINTDDVTPLPSSSSETDDSLTRIVNRSDGTFYDPASPGGTGPFPSIPVGPSAVGGNWVGEIQTSYETSTSTYPFVVQGDRASWNDDAQSGSFQSGYGHRADFYIDDLSFYGEDDGFYIQTTLLDDTNSTAVSGGGFATQVVDTGGGSLAWRIGFTGDERGFSEIDSSTLDLTSPGWYTIQTIWEDDGLGNIDRIDSLSVAGGSVVLSQTVQDVLAVGDAGQVGGAVLGNGDPDANVDSLSTAVLIDNLQVVPEPAAAAFLLGLAAVGFSASRRKRRS